MILTNKQSARFVKLLAALSTFALEEIGDEGTLDYLELGDPDGTASVRVVDVIWGEDRCEGVIDRFVTENPFGMNRRDLFQVEDWNSAIYGDFAVVRRQRDVYFLTDDYGFIVRGVDDEIDHCLSGVPIVVTTAILPFEGLITFAVGALEARKVMSPYLDEAAATAHIDQLRKDKRLARSAAEFMKLSAEGKDEIRRLHFERVAPLSSSLINRFRRWLDTGTDAPQESTLRRDEGGLTDLSGDRGYDLPSEEDVDLLMDEFEDLLDKNYLDDILADLLDEPTIDDALDELDTLCVPEPSGRLLKDYLGQLSDAQMRPIWTQMLGLDEIRSRTMGHDELAEAVAVHFCSNPNLLVQLMLQQGETGVEDARRLVEAGGSLFLDVDLLDDEDVEDVIIPFAPIIYCHQVGDDYRYVMCDDVLSALEGTNWDEVTHDAGELASAAYDVGRILEYRGIARADDLIREAVERHQFSLSTELVSTTLTVRTYLGLTPFAPCLIGGQPYVIHPDLADACGGFQDEDFVTLIHPDRAAKVLERREALRFS